MTGPLHRGGPVRSWWVALVLGVVLGGCSSTAPGTDDSAASTGTAPDTVDADAVTSTGGPDGTSSTVESGTRTPSPEDSAVTATPGAASGLDCGLTTFSDGKQAVRYCGEGEATVELAGRATLIEGAECDLRGSFLTVNVGSSFSDPEAAQGDYLGLILGGVAAGTNSAPDHIGVELVLDGKRVPVRDPEATVQLLDDGSMWTAFAAEDAEGGPLEITLTCQLTAD